MIPIWDFFTDPILRGPTLGTLFMCVASSLMGVILLFQRKSLLGESLSHASYPGILLGIGCFGLFWPEGEGAFFAVLAGAFCAAFAALKMIEWMEKRQKTAPDTALCFVLAFFFGTGTLIASFLQTSMPIWHRKAQSLLFGQAATMTDFHAAIYSALTISILALIGFAFRPIQAFLFDLGFAKTLSLRVSLLERALFWLLLLSLILGIRSVGVVLMSGMVVAPAIAARQCTDKLQWVFILSAVFGALSGFAGNVLSVWGTMFLSGSEKLVFPTGPSIILVSAVIAFLCLLFAPKKGLFFRLGRMKSFRLRCLEENILKMLWKKGAMRQEDLKCSHAISRPLLKFVLWRLRRSGWIEQVEGRESLSSDGMKKAAAIVRAHRLWELYLANELGLEGERIHLGAEEMEHVLTRDLEERLTSFLSNPKVDPHHQPIPERPQ